MWDKANLEIALKNFNNQYPRPGIEPISIQGEYDLYINWPETYPNVTSAGVYIFLNKEDEVLYVGKASCFSSFGSRFDSYFKNDPNDGKKCKVKNERYSEARKILTIPLPKGHEFEAGAIEEYLIKVLRPKLNVNGTVIKNNEEVI